jgi:putative mycofactocin binding protein MftB
MDGNSISCGSRLQREFGGLRLQTAPTAQRQKDSSMGSKVVCLRTGMRETELKTFRLADGVQVRRERFGLLFYNYRGPRIYFIPSKSFIDADFFDGRQTMGRLVDAIQEEHGFPRQKIRNYVRNILRELEDRGLIHGQSVC